MVHRFGQKEAYKLELYWTKDGSKLKGDKMSSNRVMSYEKNGTDFLQVSITRPINLGLILNIENRQQFTKLVYELMFPLQFNDVTMDNKGRYACNYKYKDGRVFTMEFNVMVRQLIFNIEFFVVEQI